MEMRIEVKIPQDTDGFIDYECPFCEKHFRLCTNEFQGDETVDTMYCPYCGLNAEPDRFLPKETEKLLEETGLRAAEDALDDMLKKMARSSKLITYKPGKKATPNNVILDESINQLLTCKSCGKTMKIDETGETNHYCPYCGGMI